MLRPTPWNKLLALIDRSVPADSSLWLRYPTLIAESAIAAAVTIDDLRTVSIREGAALFHLHDYRGVAIHVIDESSFMASGTYKDLDACLITAIANRANVEHLALSSAGNLGAALAAYNRGNRDRSIYLFYPMSTWHKLRQATTDWGSTRLVCVDRPEPEIKKLAQLFAARFDIPHVPDVEWRLAASAPRGLFVLECAAELGHCHWLSQAMCAGYGPTGIFTAFQALLRDGRVRADQIPRFLGLQQADNAPMVHAWKDGADAIESRHMVTTAKRYLEPTLYNTNPGAVYRRLHGLLDQFGGQLAAVSAQDYQRYAPLLIEWFRAAGREFTRRPGSAEVLEKTGLLTGVGILRAIDEGVIGRGERVLYLCTGGFRRSLPADQAIEPHAVIDHTMELDAWVEHLGREFGLTDRAPAAATMSH